MTKLIITRGLPGSGKSTWARAWVEEDRQHRAEVNRDMLRIMMHGGYADAEVMVTTAGHAAIRDLLKRGVDVVCSDTNLPQRTARDLAKTARAAGAEVEVHDMTNVPLDVCLVRNHLRMDKDPVPEARIREMHARYIAGKGYPLPLPVEDETVAAPDVYVPVPGTPEAVILDMDGTLALKGARSPYDESRVHEDRPNHPVIEAARAEARAGRRLIIMSARTEACRTATEEWIDRWLGGPVVGPYMRRVGDTRRDRVVKRELFDRHVRAHYTVRRVYDDRDQVVRMWREELGLPCFQVAEGNF